MKQLPLLIVLAAAACKQQPQEQAATQAPAPPENVLATSTPSSKPPAVIPMPKDQAELDRMILAGYTPHADHLHAPGVNECPLTKGNDAVM